MTEPERVHDVETSAGRLVLSTTDRQAAYDAAFREHHDWLVRRLRLLLGDPEEAQDLAQQVFVRALEHRPDVEGRPVRPWLAAVGVRLAISERRRRRRWGFLPLSEGDDAWAMHADPDLWTALRTLDHRTRAALILTVLDGFTQEEVATTFGVRRGTVASWLSRGRQKLRPVLMEVRDGPR